MSPKQIRLINFPVRTDERGKLAFAQTPDQIPFEIRRVYYSFDFPVEAARGYHAHKMLQTVMIAIAGAFDVTLDDGVQKRTFRLDRPSLGLYVPAMTWRELTHFSPGSVCLALASDLYDEADYIRDYDAFLAAVRGASGSGGRYA